MIIRLVCRLVLNLARRCMVVGMVSVLCAGMCFLAKGLIMWMLGTVCKGLMSCLALTGVPRSICILIL